MPPKSRATPAPAAPARSATEGLLNASRNMPLSSKLTYTGLGIALIVSSGGLLLENIRAKPEMTQNTRQLWISFYIFWVVLIIRTVMLLVWRIGMPKETANPRPPAVTVPGVKVSSKVSPKKAAPAVKGEVQSETESEDTPVVRRRVRRDA